MPVVLIKGDCTTPEAKRDLFFRLPLKASQKAADVDLDKVHPHMLVHEGASDKADVISWNFAGAQRIVRKGATRQMAADEAGFLMNRYPGLIEIVQGKGGDAPETAMVLMERIKKLEHEIKVLRAENDGLGEKVKTAENAADEADKLSSLRLLEKDSAAKERDAALKENEQLRRSASSKDNDKDKTDDAPKA